MAEAMRAAWYERTGPASEVLIVGELPRPVPQANQVLVRIAASGANPHDTKSRSGWTGRPMRAARVIPHADGSGIIVAAGPGVDSGRVGERVWIFRADLGRPGGGTAAEFAIVAADHAIPLPEDVDFPAGASLGVPALTAHTSVLRDGTVSGQSVLVHAGAGAVGQYAIQFARWSGARVLATASTPDKMAVARAIGADAVFDYRSPDFVDAVLDFTRGQGVDRIIEVDLGANLAADLAVLKPNGVLASYSSTRVPKPTIDYYAFARKGITLHFVQGLLLSAERRSAAIRDITAMLARGQLRHPEPALFTLGEIARAHAVVEAGAGIRKVILAINPALTPAEALQHEAAG